MREEKEAGTFLLSHAMRPLTARAKKPPVAEKEISWGLSPGGISAEMCGGTFQLAFGN
jgi:hypothetical protein